MIFTLACSPPPPSAPAPAPPQDVIGWRALGAWSGRGNTQTESFLVEGSIIRVRWQTRNEAPPGSGTFRLTFLSAVSGRELAVIADQRGAGTGEAYVPEEPRPSYMLVESEHVDWSFTVDEGHAGTAPTSGTRED